jgi:hypothetical protein
MDSKRTARKNRNARRSVDQFSTRSEMLMVLLHGARGERFARYPEWIFATPRDMFIGA